MYILLYVYIVVCVFCCMYILLYVYFVVCIYCRMCILLYVYIVVFAFCCMYILLYVYFVECVFCCMYILLYVYFVECVYCCMCIEPSLNVYTSWYDRVGTLIPATPAELFCLRFSSNLDMLFAVRNWTLCVLPKIFKCFFS